MDKSCVATIRGDARLRGCLHCSPSPTLHLLSYLPAHLGSNSGPLPRTHGQLRSIRRRNSPFHRSDRPIPWHKHEQLHSHSEVTILSQVGRRQILNYLFFYTVSIMSEEAGLFQFCGNICCCCFFVFLAHTQMSLQWNPNIFHLVPFFVWINKRDLTAALSPDESQGNDVVRVDGNEPVAVFAVWIWVRVVGRQDEAWRSGHISTTRSWARKRKEEINGITHTRSVFRGNQPTANILGWAAFKEVCVVEYNRDGFHYFCEELQRHQDPKNLTLGRSARLHVMADWFIWEAFFSTTKCIFKWVPGVAGLVLTIFSQYK